jgi:hypothetical protein
MSSNKFNHSPKWGLTFLGAIAPMTLTLVAIADLASVLPSQSVQAEQASLTGIKQKQTKPKVVKIAGTYKTFIAPKMLAEIKKEGVKSISGEWTIQPNGYFEAYLKIISIQDKVQMMRTTGRVSIINGKVVSQIETVNGKKPKTVPPTQSYTLQADGKTLQVDDNQLIQLVRQ